jgi:hypothetical protein
MIILTSKNINNQDFLVNADKLSHLMRLRKHSDNQKDQEYFQAIDNQDADKAQSIIDSEAIDKGFTVKGFHGTSEKHDIQASQQFSPECLGLATGAASAREAFFFAKSPGTSAEYAALNTGEPASGDWFWQPSNANDVIQHLRNLMFGVNLSGSEFIPDVKDMPSELWDSYGRTMQKFFQAKTPEERMKAYIDFRDPDKNSEAFEAVWDAASDNARKEAEEIVWETKRDEPVMDKSSQIATLKERNRQLVRQDREQLEKWGEESYAEFPGNMPQEQRFQHLLSKYPDNAILQEVVRNINKINQLSSELDATEKDKDTRDWEDLSPEEQYAFIEENEDEIESMASDTASSSQVMGIFKKIDMNAMDPSVFEWERGFDPSGFSIDEYYLYMKKPFVKIFEDRRDEKFVAIIQQAKKDGYDSVVFKNVRDGGGLDDIYAVFSPNQIKSAEVVTYDGNEIIPPSQRFDISKPNLNY